MGYIARANTDAVVRKTDNMIIGPENVTEWSEYQEWLLLGNTPDPVPVEIPPVPYSVSPLQMRKALNQTNLRSTIEGFVATLDQEGKDSWEYATEVLRTNPLINQAAIALGKTDEEVDDLFRLASTL